MRDVLVDSTGELAPIVALVDVEIFKFEYRATPVRWFPPACTCKGQLNDYRS